MTNNVVWQLQALPGYEMRTTKCVTCARPKRVIVAVGGLALVGPEAEVVVFLLRNKGFAFCYCCVAFATEISLQEADRVVNALQALPEFEHVAIGMHATQAADIGACIR